jgi:hypothetical protein
MGIPTNINKLNPTSKTSSNSVIWAGPDIPCISLCNGDTITEVVYNLATELCAVLDTLDISNYDISCFNINSCGPTNFKDLINFLIERICALNGVTPELRTSEGCPDCLVQVAPCFVSSGINTMQLTEYVNLIGNRLCTLITQISVITQTLEDHEDRIVVLENKPEPTFTLPDVEVTCILNSAPIDFYELDVAVSNLIVDYCNLRTATGTSTSLLQAVSYQCAGLSSSASFSNPSNTMSVEYTGLWVNSPTTVADTIKNLWLTLCDLRDNFPIVYGAMHAQVGPSDINKTAPGLNTGRLCDGTIQIMNEVYDDDNAYNPATGIWTCPATGVYDLNFFVSLTRDSGDGWYDSTTPGMFIAGLTSATGCNYYTANNFTPVVIQKHCSVSGSLEGVTISAGAQVCLKIINLTNYNYVSTAGDIVRMSIKRIK